jgi:hypothetical protein
MRDKRIKLEGWADTQPINPAVAAAARRAKPRFHYVKRFFAIYLMLVIVVGIGMAIGEAVSHL